MITIYILIKGKQMKQFIDFYMVVISPWCYLGLNRLILISKTYDIEINIKPIDNPRRKNRVLINLLIFDFLLLIKNSHPTN